jgi:hypothetical protein
MAEKNSGNGSLLARDGGWHQRSAVVDGRIVALIDAADNKPKKRGPDKKRESATSAKP